MWDLVFLVIYITVSRWISQYGSDIGQFRQEINFTVTYNFYMCSQAWFQQLVSLTKWPDCRYGLVNFSVHLR
jgi:hypothetical protein